MLVEAFMGTDVAFREELLLYRNSKRITQKEWHPGCTAIAALVIREKLYVANAGDCRAILNRAGQPFPMSKVICCFKIT
jgi:serine/threonine protein phosphatase PrpC